MGELTTDIALLPSLERTATIATDDLRSAVEDKALYLFLDVSKAPNTAETLTLQVEVKDEVSGKYVPITAFAASKKGEELGAGTTLVFIVGAASAETAAVGNVEGQALPLPRHFRVKVTHSSNGKWTYSLGYSFC